MVTATLLTAALSMLAPIAACFAPTHALYDVAAVHGPVDVSTDLTLAQIAELADRTGRVGRHPPLGFYTGGVGFIVSTDISARSETDCSRPVRVTVKVMLVNRHIEIGKELVANPCLFSVVRDHYRRHAASDDAVLTEFARKLGATLQHLPLPSLAHDPTLAEEDQRRMEKAVTSAIDPQLEWLDATRANARDQVDTDEEVKKLKAAQCSRA